MTGSLNQYGRVQAIGGVNEKIEGFFDIRYARGLTGEPVTAPDPNVKDLMLRRDGVDACTRGAFHIYAVGTADEAIALLTACRRARRTRMAWCRKAASTISWRSSLRRCRRCARPTVAALSASTSGARISRSGAAARSMTMATIPVELRRGDALVIVVAQQLERLPKALRSLHPAPPYPVQVAQPLRDRAAWVDGWRLGAAA